MRNIILELSICLVISVSLSASLWLFYWVLKTKNIRFSLNEVDFSVLLNNILASSVTFMWYSVSLSLTLYNKWILKKFEFPMTVTAVHIIIKFIMSRIWKITSNIEYVPLSWKNYLFLVLPIGLFTVLDIFFSNIAITHLSLSIFTIVKSSTLIFIFLWGILLRVENLRFGIALSILAIFFGICVTVGTTNRIDIDSIGLIFAILSSASGGLRWVLMKMLIYIDSDSMNSMLVLYRFSPISVIVTIPLVYFTDFLKLSNSQYMNDEIIFKETLVLLLFGGLIASILIIVELQLLSLITSLSMGVLGQVKEILQIIIAMILFKDEFSIKSAVGVAVSLIGSFYYRYLRVLDSGSNVLTSNKSSFNTLDNEVEVEIKNLTELVPLNVVYDNINGSVDSEDEES
jgi:solute carrier family 35 protein C2